MNAPLPIVDLCHAIGARIPIWTQGPGGNVSLKVRDDGKEVLLIKASGLRLDQVKPDRGIARVALERFKSAMAAARTLDDTDDPEPEYARILGECPLGAERPSMETGFHALLPARWVVHFHSLPALLMASHYAESPERLSRWLSTNANGFSVAFLSAERPGWRLALKVQDAAADVLILANHGLIAQLEQPADLDRWADVEARFCGDFGYPLLAELLSGGGAAAGPLGADEVTPLKLYFPDSAVFLDRLTAVLEPADTGAAPGFRLAADGWTRDRDAAELWLATVLLHRSRPELEELPQPIAETVAALPTELFRRRVAAARS